MIQQISVKVRTPRERVLSGSAVLLAGLGFVTLVNFAYNLAVARFLGPIAFGHTTAVYTLLILISAVTLSFQILTAKIVAQQGAPEAQARSYSGFHVRAWAAGVCVCLSLILFRGAVSQYLNLRDPLLILLLAFGTLFYVPLGARRGYIQGVCKFQHLASNLVLEGLVRLCGSLLMIWLGFGVRGVIAANSAAVIMAYLFARSKMVRSNNLTLEVPVAFREGLQAAVFFAGQVVINNCDIVVVKHFFPPEMAGIYAAVAMVGRVVFAFSWAIVSSMFPIAAQSRNHKQEAHGVLGTSMALVAGICLVFIAGLRIAPGALWTHLFGPQFASVGGANFRYLLVLYALAAGIYGLSVVLIAYEMSRKIANTGWVQLLVGGAVITGIYLFHSSLQQVIWVQVAMMVVLLVCVSSPFLIKLIFGETQGQRMPGIITLQRRVSEEEVITEFLRNDARCPVFQPYQELLEGLVEAPDFNDEDANRMRRALLNLRHGPLWRELPKDTEWFQADIQPRDLHRIRVFPRAQWRKLALGDFQITQVATRIADERFRERTTEAFREKIHDLRYNLQGAAVGKSVLLIGKTERGPFTVLDGNHRLVAAMLASPPALEQLRFFCGLSPNMDQCCWYQTNVLTLARYGTNLVRHLARDPERALEKLVHAPRPGRAQPPIVEENEDRSVASS